MTDRWPEKCKTCGEPAAFPGADRCTNCWEVEGRLDSYLRLGKGRAFVAGRLAKALFLVERHKRKEGA